MNALTAVLVVIGLAAIAVAVFMYMLRERTRRLRNRFGPEYDRVVQREGDARTAEEELLRRQKRIETFQIRELTHAETDRFLELWRVVQARFVDEPREAVAEADRLVGEVMKTRGYPITEFGQSAADISVDHPSVVQNYRAAHNLAARDAAGKATTEDLRQAMVHYRALFEDLLTMTKTHVREEVHR